MRTILVVTFALVGSTAFAKPPPCPTGLEAKLAAQYGDAHVDPDSIKISACVWGNFAGPGWFVFHLVPKSPSAESAAEGGEVFVAKDGTIAAAAFVGGMQDQTVRVIDLDGDGVDEIVTTLVWRSSMSPDNGEVMSVYRVVGDKIEAVFAKNITYAFKGQTPEDFACTGKLAIVDGPKHTKQLVVTVRTSGDAAHIADSCLAKGKHVFRYTKADGITEVTK